jgi:hypothetical protein
MRRLALLFISLVTASAQSPGPSCAIASPACSGGGGSWVLCSTQVSQNTSTTGGSSCGLFPSGFSTNWTFNVQVINTVTHAVYTQTSTTVSGTGWCPGLYQHCFNPNTGLDTPYVNAVSQFNSTGAQSGFFTWVGEVTSAPSATSGPLICASPVTTSQPSPPIQQTAAFCPQTPSSPIIIDTADEGFHLTDAADGVDFARLPGGRPVRLAWTDPRFRNGWLALPRDGKVESLSELFGNFTPQPKSDHQNGFIALAIYDLNHDGVIDAKDAVYTRLRVWIDANHDGIAQPEELHTLEELGIERISLDYRESRWMDQFGNQFRYVSAIADSDAPRDKRTYDVFLTTKP